MMSFSDILLPLDGSDHSKFACDLAYKFAEVVPGRETMHLLYCVESIPNLIDGPGREKLQKQYEEEAEKIFAPCVELFAKIDNPCRTYVRYGSPGKVIAETAEELNCSLIIMGCRGRGGLASTVLGSVSNHVLQHSKVPVLLTKAAS